MPKTRMPTRALSPFLSAAAAVALAAPGAAWAQAGAQDYGPHMWDGNWFGWFVGPMMMILFIAVAVVVVALLVRWLGFAGHGPHHHPAGRTALDILKERFARGEIDKAEFEERRRALGD